MHPNLRKDGGTLVLWGKPKRSNILLNLGRLIFQGNEIRYLEVYHRRKGYGTRLLLEAEERIRSRCKYTYVYLQPIPNTRGFYIKNGYRKPSLFDYLRSRRRTRRRILHEMIKEI